MNEWMDIHAQMNGWIGGWIDKQTLNRPWIVGSMVGWLGHISKHTCTNLQKVDGHCHLSTCDVSSKLLAHSAEWKIANLRKKGGGREGGREGGRSFYKYFFFTIQTLTVVSGARKSLSRKST